MIPVGHTHRQNCLKEYGLQQLVQKLELTNDSLLQDLLVNVSLHEINL